MWNLSEEKARQLDFYINNLTDFDWKYYIKTYPDLIKKGIDTELKAKQHYLLHGKKEKRRIKELIVENSKAQKTRLFKTNLEDNSTIIINIQNFSFII